MYVLLGLFLKIRKKNHTLTKLPLICAVPSTLVLLYCHGEDKELPTKTVLFLLLNVEC